MKGKMVVIGILVILLFSSLAVGFEGAGMHKNSIEKKSMTNNSGQIVEIDGVRYTTYDVIRINSDADFNSTNGVVSGSGTQSDPYIISGWDIDAHGAGDAIYIGNTTVYFVVENCRLYNVSPHSWPYFDGAGITLYRVTNGRIANNTISNNNWYGIYLESSSSNTIANNTISNNNDYGIYLDYSSSNTIANNTISNNGDDGIHLWESSSNTIANNTISNNTGYGIYLASGSHNLIYYNFFYYNHGSGSTYNSSHVQAYDDGSNNSWNSTTGIGNYWYDWANNNDTNDQNGDGIVDWEYKIGGSAGAKDYYPLKYTPHSIIRINGDADFTSQNGVVGGSGTQSDPYIISGWDIDAQGAGYAIYIGNTTAYFVVENCYLHGASFQSWPYLQGAGIMLYNVKNGKINNNTVSSNERGIMLYSSNGNVISNNNLTSNDQGVYLYSSTNNTILNNTASDNSYGIFLYYYSNNNAILNNNASTNDEGIYIWASNNSIILNNIVLSNHYDGIYLYVSLGNKLGNNTLAGNGISISGALEHYTTNEIYTNNTVNGKPVYFWKNMSGGKIPAGAGEVILANCTDVLIENQNLSYGSIDIEVAYSSNITIRNNNCSNNVVYGSGIYLWKSVNSTIYNNTLINSGYGIVLYYYSDNNTISNNTIETSHYDGIYLWASNNNTITNNIISNNSEYGIYLTSGTSHNLIYYNFFYYNHGSGSTYNSPHIQAYDDGNNNYWNSLIGIGNYWCDWANNNNTNDQNHDGIVDWSYPIDGSAGAKDYYPLKNKSLSNVLSHPMNLTAIAGNGYVNLTWELPVYGKNTVTQYNLYRNGAFITSVPATQLYYNDTNVVNGQTYTYYVTAVNSIGESDKSNEVQATPGSEVPEIQIFWIPIIGILLLIGILRKRSKTFK